MAKLIVLRGPSGSGKSTVARVLHRQVLHKTALIEQDYYRHQLFNNPHDDLEAARHVMCASIQTALDHGYDVILEGILSMGKYQTYFDKLLAAHPHENYWFYFDVAFDETVRRHNTRDKRAHFSAADMRDWYPRATPTGYTDEHIIAQNLSAEDACRLIIAITGVFLQP